MKLKNTSKEYIHVKEYKTTEQAKLEVFEYIEV